MKQSWDISRSYIVDDNGNCGFTGQEMITEMSIPYIDFYQTRAASGSMGGMEHTYMVPTLNLGVSFNIPLFEYIYKEYCGVRCDGFTLPLEEIGTCYYYDIAYTALNGAIPEFNYECIQDSLRRELYSTMNDDMIEFVDNLGKARLTYGKEYLTYASMTRVPNLNISYQKEPFETPIYIDWGMSGRRFTGSMYIEPVASCAYKSNGKVAIFLCDVLEEDKALNFTIDAKTLYGIENGTLTIYEDGVEKNVIELENGIANIDFTLSSRKVYMIEIK